MSDWSAPQPRMPDREYRLFAEHVRAHCGLSFGDETRFLLEKRIRCRMEELGVTSGAAYLHELRKNVGSDSELARLVDDLTTNETYFFRERSQLRALIGEILPEALHERSARGKPVHVWSAGCSSGEEPYSVAILAKEAGFHPESQLRIYASDISRRMLRRARQATYRESSFRETEPALRERYFEEKEGLWRLSDEVRRCVDFIHLNLLDESRIALLGPMDVILCRNVIIYFDTETKMRVIGGLEGKLRPGGHLLLGHSESLINVSTGLELRHLKSDLVYRRPAPGTTGSDPWHLAAEAALASVEERS